MGVTGCGDTMEEAYSDMWQLYKEVVRRKPDFAYLPARC